MHICVALVGISYDPTYNHRKIKTPVKVDATMLVANQTKYVFDDLKKKGHTYDVVLSTNKHEKLDTYTKQLRPVWIDTKSTSFIPDDRIHHMNEYFENSDLHFISNRRYQSNTDVMQNPLFDFQRSSMDHGLNPNMENPQYLMHFKGGYKSVKNIHPDFEKCITLLSRVRKIN